MQIKLSGVGVEQRVLEFTVSTQIVATCVRGPTQRALKPAREVNVIVVANVGYNFATKFASMQVGVEWQLVKRKSHVPAF